MSSRNQYELDFLHDIRDSTITSSDGSVIDQVNQWDWSRCKRACQIRLISSTTNGNGFTQNHQAHVYCRDEPLQVQEITSST